MRWLFEQKSSRHRTLVTVAACVIVLRACLRMAIASGKQAKPPAAGTGPLWNLSAGG